MNISPWVLQADNALRRSLRSDPDDAPPLQAGSLMGTACLNTLLHETLRP